MESRLTDINNNTTELEVKLGAGVKQLEGLRTELEVRLSANEEQLEDLKTQNTVQSVQLSLINSSLTESHNNTTALEVKLRSTETQLEQQTAALEVRLDVSEKQLEDLKTENTGNTLTLFTLKL
ncbi:paramyosin-like [Notothenia coriiceps]|uniref:Paramyosin-like n=1 Tax=Notothenia coriiceps TaxID=8208 RepID=A0A6I9MK07_9TELE|nr:PREDICTED: paramyosin-like [Notothenia coriiceps]